MAQEKDNLKPIKPITEEKKITVEEQKTAAPEKPLKIDSQKTPLSGAAQIEPTPQPTQPTGHYALIKKKPPARILKITLGALFVLICLGAVYFFFFYRAKVIIATIQKPDRVLIDGKETGAVTIYLLPGRHSIAIEKSGYLPYFTISNLSRGQKIDLKFSFVKTPKATLISQGASLLTQDKKIYFVDEQKFIASVFGGEKTPGDVTQESVATFPTIKNLIVSQDSNLAYLSDDEAIKIIDLTKTDIINQTQTKLPIDGKLVTMMASNYFTNNYFDSANSFIVFDQKAINTWALKLIKTDMSRNEYLMDIDPNKFINPKIEWAADSGDIIITGGSIGQLDLTTRTYSDLSDNKDYIFSKASPKGTRIFALRKGGEAEIITGNSRKEINLSGVVPVCGWKDESSAYIIFGNQLVLYNFDTDQAIGYAGGNEISSANTLVVGSNVAYFMTGEGLSALELVKEVY